jgi:hypothetical protein
VLRELLHRDEDDSEVLELAALQGEEPMVSELVNLQSSEGFWKGNVFDVSLSLGTVQVTSQALMRLGYLGYTKESPVIKSGAEYLFSAQREDGSWEIPQRGLNGEEREGYSMIPLQTAIPLKALAGSGYATDPRAERAYKWLLEQRLEDGAWPTGMASGNYGSVAGYRRVAHSRWGCRSNTTGVLSCLALHPKYRKSPEAQRAMDLLLGRETRERKYLGFEVARQIGVERTRGFLTYYARFDLAQMLDLCWRIGASLNDERVSEIVEFVVGHQGKYGLWEYPANPQASRWITFDLLRSLSRLDTSGDWVSMEPRTPFMAYPKKHRRV